MKRKKTKTTTATTASQRERLDPLAKLQSSMDELITMLAQQKVPPDVAQQAAAAALCVTPDQDTSRISGPFRYLSSMYGAVAQVLEDAGL